MSSEVARQSTRMHPTNVNKLYYSNFLYGTSLSKETEKHEFIWWGLVITEVLLSIRLILGYFDASLTNSLTYAIHTITHYVVYPFAATLTNLSGEVSSSWITTVAIIGYFLLTITLVGFFNAIKSPHSRIERARALSRRKYSR